MADKAHAGPQRWSNDIIEPGDQVQYGDGRSGIVGRLDKGSVGLVGPPGRLQRLRYDRIKSVKDDTGRSVRLQDGVRTVCEE